MLDLWSNQEINEMVDVWVSQNYLYDIILCVAKVNLSIYTGICVYSNQDLGCLLYILCYSSHPFDDTTTGGSSKLAILNAKYSIPKHKQEFRIYDNLIRELDWMSKLGIIIN